MNYKVFERSKHDIFIFYLHHLDINRRLNPLQSSLSLQLVSFLFCGILQQDKKPIV